MKRRVLIVSFWAVCFTMGMIYNPPLDGQLYAAKESFSPPIEEPETWYETRLYTQPYDPPIDGLRVRAVPNTTLVTMNFYQFVHSYFLRTNEAYQFDPTSECHPPFLAEDVYYVPFKLSPVAKYCMDYLQVPAYQEECFYCAQWDIILYNSQMEELVFDGKEWVSLAGNGGSGEDPMLNTYMVSEYTYIIPTHKYDGETLVRSDAWMRSCVFNATKTTNLPTINRVTCMALRYKVMPVKMVCDVYVY